ncbi:MAG: hypothetical protein NT120_01415 [Candidatus Aenigmarchaeota archaeon]|nr:hypothetical protein [Candidatus Aenigmarchaeota archaeon]
MKTRYSVLLLLLVFSTCASAVEFSVGVSPPVVDVGEVDQGEQKIVKFSIFTVSDENLLVYLDVESGNMDFFAKGYKDLMANFSEEPTMRWVQFINNPVEIDTKSSKTAGRAWKDVTFILNIPRDAEPGYHVIKINPQPTVYGNLGAPVGTSIVATTSVSILFNVKGDAKRDGIILDSTAAGYANNPFTIKTFFRNTGTTTLYGRSTTKVYDINGNNVNEYYSAKMYVNPNTVATFETPVNDNLKEGDYNIVSSVAFTTGTAEKNATIHLYKQEAGAAPQQQPNNTLIIIFAIIIIIVLIVAYRWFSERR